MNQWKSIFIGMAGERRVKIERGDSGTYRVTTFHQGTEATFQIHGETPGALEQNLKEQGLFSADEAHEMVQQILYR